ncbi:hypothetical protein BSKO_04412 [Bryopsis sp. KO-2023]|nr:hypothetical protein BSKO_04412 [Bryopsis sp. KO-2023]
MAPTLKVALDRSSILPNYFDTEIEPSLWRTRWEKLGEEKAEFLNMHCLADYGFKLKVPPSGPGMHKLTSGKVHASILKWPGGQLRSDKNARSNCKVRFLKKIQVWRICQSNGHIELPTGFGMEKGKYQVEFIVWKAPCPMVPISTLDELIESEPGGVAETTICQVLQNIGWGLAWMHFKGVVHWDVTTATIQQHSFPGLVVFKLGGSFDKIQRRDLRRLSFESKSSPSYDPPAPTNDSARSADWDVYALGVCALQLALGCKKEKALKQVAEDSVGPTPTLSPGIRELILYRESTQLGEYCQRLGGREDPFGAE